ncbi:MAG: tetratricopeptide repeat protein [Thermoanaerobaculia bacterium]|nr:tetratricopeptide repeat protein [Thermoanaerobaculia bacterium]
MLALERYAVILGEGGEGKTTLAVELVRWLVKTRRFGRAAFVGMEHCLDARSALFALGDQLVEGFVSQAVQDETLPWQLVERALHDEPTIVVFDNMESVLPAAEGSPAAEVFEPEVLEAILDLCRRLVWAGETRVVFTSREALPEPFASNVVEISRLGKREAIELVGKVLGEGRLMPLAADPGESEEEIESLVEAVGCHARSLVLLANEVAASGVRWTTERMGELMAALAAKHPDDRERSLFASVELSLRRLPEATRRRLPRLAVFRGGGHLACIAVVLGLGSSPEPAMPVAKQLVDVGLAELMAHEHLRLHPALGPALDRELNAGERGAAEQAWIESMVQLTEFLYQQQFKNAQQAATMARLELPNLLAALERLGEVAETERVVKVATNLEGLLRTLGRPRSLAKAAAIRAAASPQLKEWSHGRFLAEAAAIDRLLDAGRFVGAVEATRKLVQMGLAAGATAFPEATYDLAMAHFKLGRALLMDGAADAALAPLTEARNRFQKLAEAGDANAATMATASLTEIGDCLSALGQLAEAVHTYETAIELDKAQNNLRGVAIGKNQLGSARLLQGQPGGALAAYTEAREIFEKLEESGSVAAAWHQIGVVYQDAGQLEAAELAYQKSLKIEVQRGNRSGEADTLCQLGNLYDSMGRLEDAVGFSRHAAEIYSNLEDSAKEGVARGNIAIKLIKLRYYDDARQEILRAIECDEAHGLAGEPWKTFEVLRTLENALGNAAAATEARERALQLFLAYRRTGSENYTLGGQLATVLAEALNTGQTAEIAAQLAAFRERPDLPGYLKPMIPALQAILAGSRDPTLAADPTLNYDLAAEILLLLETLTAVE